MCHLPERGALRRAPARAPANRSHQPLPWWQPRWVMVAAPAQLQCQPSVPTAALFLRSILWKAPVKHFLGAASPRAVAITAGAPGQPAAERNPQRALPEYHGAANCAVSWSSQAPSLELCLSHYYASAHFALFTFLLFKEITLKCTSAGSTFAFLELSIDISSNCLQLP